MLTKEKIKSRVARALAVTLVFSMSLSPLSTIPVYASAVGDHGNTGGGNGNMGATSDYKAWNESQQGYRIYVINSNLERISPTYDFVYSTPTYGKALYTTRFDTINSPNEHKNHTIKDLQNWTGSSKSVPEPTIKPGDTRKGNGEAFKNWFFNGQSGTSIPGNGGGNKGSGGGSYGAGGLDPWGDADGDGVRNGLDPYPYNSNRQ